MAPIDEPPMEPNQRNESLKLNENSFGNFDNDEDSNRLTALIVAISNGHRPKSKRNEIIIQQIQLCIQTGELWRQMQSARVSVHRDAG